MTGVDVLRVLLSGSFGMVQERLNAISDQEWNQRAFPSTSKPGFILWHCARILDWTIHSALQGIAEVADSSTWQGRFAREACYGAGIADSLADEVTASTSRTEVAAYLRDVRAAVMDWFAKQTESSLDAAPPLKTNQANRAGYLDPNIWAEVEISMACRDGSCCCDPRARISDATMGEYDVLVGAMRSRTTTRA